MTAMDYAEKIGMDRGQETATDCAGSIGMGRAGKTETNRSIEYSVIVRADLNG